MYRRIIAYLLHVANSSAPVVNRHGFYDLKQRLLTRYGSFQKTQIQEIVHECYGRGNPYDGFDGCKGTNCRKCGGSSVYQRKLFSLQLWRFGRYEFHTPNGRLYSVPAESQVEIRGRIDHADYGRWANEARLWLYLLTGEFRLFWSDLTGHSYCTPGPFPLCWLQKLAFLCALKLSRRTCWCGRKFFTWGSGWQICKHCREENARDEALWRALNDDMETENDPHEVPF